jgi:DNA-binding GntR family transcriptional regulator
MLDRNADAGVVNRKLVVPSVVDMLYDAIRVDILEGRISPSSKLTEVSVAAAFSVARPTAKAALERLIHEGLLRRDRNKSARVPQLDSADIRDLYRSRGFLEREAAAELARRSYVPSAARAAHEVFQEGIASSDASTIVSADVALHSALLDSIGSPRLSKMYQSIIGEFQLCMAQEQAKHLLSPEVIGQEHSDILDAIAGGDVSGAVVAMDLHLDAGCSTFITHLQIHS